MCLPLFLLGLRDGIREVHTEYMYCTSAYTGLASLPLLEQAVYDDCVIGSKTDGSLSVSNRRCALRSTACSARAAEVVRAAVRDESPVGIRLLHGAWLLVG
jgi:hypothetical protein